MAGEGWKAGRGTATEQWRGPPLRYHESSCIRIRTPPCPFYLEPHTQRGSSDAYVPMRQVRLQGFLCS
eukprot:4613879-Alexandrium_andersonii.AAC.1